MSREELVSLLQSRDIRPEAYCFDCDWPGECHVLRNDGGRWLVYYSERGERNALKAFDDEGDANDFFAARILADASALR